MVETLHKLSFFSPLNQCLPYFCVIQTKPNLHVQSSTKFGSTVAVCLPARVLARSSTPTTASTDTISLCVTSLTTGRVLAISPCWARTTIEEIILNLNVWGEEERKRTALASSRKRAEILYPLKWKFIVLVFNKLVCVMSIFYLFFVLLKVRIIIAN